MAERITIEFGGERIEIPEFAMDSSVKALHKALNQQGIKTSKTATDTKKAIENLVKQLVGVNAKLNQKTQLATEKATLKAVQDVGRIITDTNKSTIGVSNNIISSYKGTIAALTKIREAIKSQQMSPEVIVNQDGVAPKQDATQKKSIKTLIQEFVGKKSTKQEGVVPQLGKDDNDQKKPLEWPEFAMDDTVKDLINVTKGIGVQATKDAVASKDSLESLMKDFINKGSKATSKKEVDAQKQTTDAVKRVKDAIQTSTKSQKGLLSKLGGGTGSILGGVVSKFGKFGKMLNPVTAGLLGMFNAVKYVTQFLLKLGRLENSVFRRGFMDDLSDGPGGVADGIAVLSARALDASLSIDEFIELTSQFATAVGEFGTETISKAITNTQDLLKSQGYLGLSNSEMAYAVGEMAEQFRALGIDVRDNDKFLANHTVSVLRTTQAFTKMTNVSNDVIRGLVMQATAMEAFRNAMHMIPKAQRAAQTQAAQVAFAGLASFGEDVGSQLTTALSEAIGRGGLQFTDFGQQMAGVSPVLFGALQELATAAGGGSTGDTVEALDKFRTGVIEVSDSQRQFLRALEISGDPMAKFTLKMINYADTIDDATFAEMKRMEELKKSGGLGVAQRQLELAIMKIKTAFSKLMIAFLTEDTVKAFGKGIEKVVSGLEGFARFLKENAFDMINSFVNAVSRAVRFIYNLFSGGGDAMGQVVGTAQKAISTTAARVTAEYLWGGWNSDDFRKLDDLVPQLKTTAEGPDRDKIADEIANTFGVTRKNKWSVAEQRHIPTESTEDLIKRIQEKKAARKFGYQGDWSYNPGYTGEFKKSEDGNMLGAQPNRNIKILPMYGNLEDYADANMDPRLKAAIEQNKNLKIIIANQEKQLDLEDGTKAATEGVKSSVKQLESSLEFQNEMP